MWTDRAASHQFTGDMSPTANAPEIWEYHLKQFGASSASSASAEGDEPYGSAGASHLTAGSVRNGDLAPRYWNTRSTDAGWRFWLEQTNTSPSNVDFEGTIYLYGNTAV